MRRGKRAIAELVAIGLVVSGLGIALALAIDWFPTAGSTQAGPIDTFWDVLLIVSIPIFVLVTTIVLVAVTEFRVRPGQENQDGPPIHGNTRLEVIWTAIPSLIIAALVLYAYLVLHDIEKAPAKAADELRVKVVGEQFAWHFEYPQPGGKPSIKSDQLYVPVDRSVKFDIVSRDVLHSFWVPAWRMKIDSVPGIVTNFRVTPNRLGRYPVVCAELCGLGHAFMRQTVHVLPAKRFEAWLARQAKPAEQAESETGEQAQGQSAGADGKGVYAAEEFGCAACHTLADAGSTGTTGPNLDEALADKDAAYIREAIVAPDKTVPEGFQKGIMPGDYGQRLTPDQLQALVKYLDEVTAK